MLKIVVNGAQLFCSLIVVYVLVELLYAVKSDKIICYRFCLSLFANNKKCNFSIFT